MQKVEILKTASKMIVSFLITIWNNKVDVKHLNFDFLWMFRGLIIQTIKMEHWFDSECWFIQDGVQDGHHFKANST